MNDNTIIDFPQKGLKNGIKIAKLSTLKRDAIIYKYNRKLSELHSTMNNSNVSMVNASSKSDMTTLDNISIIEFKNNCKNNGTRKLKVSKVVPDKSKKYYLKNQIVTSMPEVNTPKDDNLSHEVSEEVPMSDTRMSRLGRTEEINKIAIDETPANNIINTPERFIEKSNNPYESLINDKEPNINQMTRESIHNEDKSEQNMGGDPNLYTKLVHGKDDNYANTEISSKLQNAINELDIAKSEREQAKAVNATLEAEVANVRETLDRLRREKDAQEKKALEDTLSMLKDAKADILDETRKYDNLQEELKALIKERDALLKSPFVNKDNDEYSARKAA